MEDKLIESVQMFPCIFDKKSKAYKNKLLKEKAWTSVATATGASIEQCQSRWRSLRDRYVRQVAVNKSKSGAAADEKIKWRYMESMSFLRSHVEPRSTFSNSQWSLSQEDSSVEVFSPEILYETSAFSETDSTLTSSFVSNSNNDVPQASGSRKRQKMQEDAHKKFDELCGVVSDFIASKKQSPTPTPSRNADFLKLLDSYLLKHS